ncbi:thermonuclease family protein [Emcibacter sp.]|uniref:thermonuclease family protein n=1 Tax=Emcibacter sp. TaxID=1979954 RepID=UPI003A8E74A9
MGRVLKYGRKRPFVLDIALAMAVGVVIGAAVHVSLPANFMVWLSRIDLSVGRSSLAGTETITGPAVVIDGDTLSIHGRRIRLHAIDAPELSQNCTLNGSSYSCGYESKRYLESLIAGRTVTCHSRDTDKYGRALATCFVGEGADLNARMVESGQAIAYLYFSRAYAGQQSDARDARRGIWKGEFTEPYQYRKRMR